MFVLQLLLGLCGLLWVYFIWGRRKFYMLAYRMPGPLGFPLLGMAHKLRRREDILGVFINVRKKYGATFVSWLGPYPVLIISEPQMAQEILSSPVCINKSIPYNVITDITGNGLFSMDNPQWREHRKLLNPAFSHRVLMSFLPTFNQAANTLKLTIDELVGIGEVDLTMILRKCTLNVAAETTMGKQMTNSNENDRGSLLHSYNCLLKSGMELIFSPWLQCKLTQRLYSNYDRYSKSKAQIRNFIQNLIREKLSQQNNSVSKKEFSADATSDDTNIQKNKNIFVDQAIDLAKRGNFTWQDVQNQSNVIVFGAFETTANTIFCTLMMLAMFPKYQERVFEELSALLPNEDDDVSYEDIQKMIYMDMVINETMRVMAPVPLVARHTSSDVRLSNGIVLPKGLQIAIDIFSMHRAEEYWGSEATTFNPNNFLPDNMAGKHPYTFIPFTKGIRNCIGWRYGLISTKVMLGKLLRRFRFSTQFKFQDLHFVEDFSIKLKVVPLLEIHKRNC